MKLIEYQAKEIFGKYGLPIQKGFVARTPEEVRAGLIALKFPVVIKSQVPVGGRGKAGGIKLANNADEALEKATAILGMEIKGIRVKKILITEAVDIAKELYLGIVQDRRAKAPVVMVSADGGVDIEEVARTKPEAIHKLTVDPVWGLQVYQARDLAYRLDPDPQRAKYLAQTLSVLWRIYRDTDATLAEINPFVFTKQGEPSCVDAKILVDDSALFRHPDLEAMRDPDYENPQELEAKAADLSFVKLDGRIGCCVNGAGLAMATMDVIKHFGGEPANFLDVGGSSSPEKVKKAFSIILRDPNVRSIYLNIFGGITRCDDIAQGLVDAFGEMDIKVPVVVRLTGTNEERARQMLSESKLPLIPAATMSEGAKKAVELAG
ncbi:MAG: ADP-forming succinate--CoA ligase subunit beta [candidate division WOR-3 bacterium]